jgi:hypothetical protein
MQITVQHGWPAGSSGYGNGNQMVQLISLGATRNKLQPTLKIAICSAAALHCSSSACAPVTLLVHCVLELHDLKSCYWCTASSSELHDHNHVRLVDYPMCCNHIRELIPMIYDS